MSSEEFANKIAQEEKELKEMLNSHNVVDQAKMQLQRDIIALQLKKKDLEMSLSKSQLNINQKRLTIKMLTAEFWREKNQGR